MREVFGTVQLHRDAPVSRKGVWSPTFFQTPPVASTGCTGLSRSLAVQMVSAPAARPGTGRVRVLDFEADLALSRVGAAWKPDGLRNSE